MLCMPTGTRLFNVGVHGFGSISMSLAAILQSYWLWRSLITRVCFFKLNNLDICI